jgi:nitroimidazol reductase NimA-like FMN-containing flavoprotein (pyridoxamine 5'-phosphate oxidase superfamily)
MRRSDREISDISEVEEIIRKADVCRLAFANDNIPYIVTMNFGFSNDPEKMLFFHCANEGKKLDMISKNDYVCFEMDVDHQLLSGKKGCNWGMKFSSIIGYGKISVVTEKEERITGLNCIMAHYGGRNQSYDPNALEKTTVLRLQIQEISGKKR